MAKVIGFDHVSIIVADASKALHFYQDLLNVQLKERPELGFPGYWIDLGAGQTIHIMQLDNPNKNTERPAHGGRDYHFALRVDAIDSFKEKLTTMGVEFTESRSGRKALFCKDLDNNAFELFEYEEALY